MEMILGWFRHNAALRERARREEDVGRTLHGLESQVDTLKDKIASLEESLERERVENRVHLLEIEQLNSVIARNLKRVEAETAVAAATVHREAAQ